MAVRDPARGTVFIGVARARNPMRQRSTLAHELGHVLSGDWTGGDAGSWSDRSPSEIRADSFARHLLAPVDGLRGFLGTRRPASLPVLSSVAQRFLVSPQIAAIALEQADYIDEATKRDWMALSARTWPPGSGGATSTRRCRQTRTGAGHRSGCLPARSPATRKASCPRRPSPRCAACRSTPSWQNLRRRA